MIEEKKLLTAYHESGQADVGLNVVATDPIHKVTVILLGSEIRSRWSCRSTANPDRSDLDTLG